MVSHILKIEEKYAKRLFHNSKSYELRFNDRDFQVGDNIRFIINNFEDSDWDLPYYKITHILQDVEEYGLKKGFCILSLKVIN